MKIVFDKEDLESIWKQLNEWIIRGIDNMVEEDMVYEAIDVAFMKGVWKTIWESLSDRVNEMVIKKISHPTFLEKLVDKRLEELIK